MNCCLKKNKPEPVPLEIRPGTTENSTIKMDAATGTGGIRFLRLNQGITLTIMDCHLRKPVCVEFEPPFESLGFGFNLSGQMEVHPGCSRDVLTFRPGQSDLNLIPGTDRHMEILEPGRLIRVCLTMDHGVLKALTRQNTGGLPLPLRQKPGEFAHFKGRITPSMRAVIAQIMDCPFQGFTRDLFLDGKVLELLSHKLRQLELLGDAPGPGLSARDRDRVLHAADLLTGNLDAAPGLAQLACSVGMCRTRLHECFCRVHGVSPLEYLQRQRLETAMAHLAAGRMNVTQAAFAVGYSSSGYFSKVFKKQYGRPPKAFMAASPK